MYNGDRPNMSLRITFYFLPHSKKETVLNAHVSLRSKWREVGRSASRVKWGVFPTSDLELPGSLCTSFDPRDNTDLKNCRKVFRLLRNSDFLLCPITT